MKKGFTSSTAILLLMMAYVTSTEARSLSESANTTGSQAGGLKDNSNTQSTSQKCPMQNREPCPDGNPGVRCKDDPCNANGSSCKGTCYTFICTAKSSYRGQQIGGACVAVWLDDNCDVVSCNKKRL